MKSKVVFWLITTLLLILFSYVLTVVVILPVSQKHQLPNAVQNKKVSEASSKKSSKQKSNKKEDDQIEVDAPQISEEKVISDEELLKLFELRKKEVLLRSRYMLSKGDSIYLVLNLLEKKAKLEVKGVVMRECKILDYSVSNSISMFHTDELLNWIARPFTMIDDEASIEKTPVIVTIAPKDTIEANRQATTPIAPKKEDVFIVMNFERNLRITIDQVKSEVKDSTGVGLDLKAKELKEKYRKQEVMKSVNALKTRKREPIKPEIHLILSKEDATIIYRALPQTPDMVLVM